MNLKKLLPIALMSVMLATGCNTGSKYGVKITNKEAIAAEGFYDTMQRELDIELTPEGNVMLELGNGNLTVESSDASTVSVSGIVLTALKEGTVTITVKYYDAIDKVKITTAGAKPAPAPVQATCAEVMAADDTAGGYIYEGWGYLVSWGTKTGPSEYGEMGLADSPTSTKDSEDYMYVYGAFVNPGEGKQGFKWDGTKFVKDYDRDFLTAELTKDLKFGDKIKFRGIRADYKTTKEVLIQVLDVEPAPYIEATSIKLGSTSLELVAGTSAAITATVEPENCNRSIAWTTSDEKVATVDKNGNVTAVAGGTATITATVSEKTATVKVTVIELAENETLVNSATLGLKNSYAPETPYTGSSKGVTFTVENVGEFGNGIQFCKVGHDTYGAGALWNTTAFAAPVTKITIKPSATKSFYDNTDAFKVTISNNADFSDAKTQLVSTVKNAAEVVVELENTGTFIKIEVNIGYTMYVGSFIFTTGEGSSEGGETPVAKKVTLTGTTLGLGAKYSSGEVEVDGYTVKYTELFYKDAGIQMRSQVYIDDVKTPLTAETRSQLSIDFGTEKIAKIELSYASSKTLKYDGKDALEFTYNDATAVDETLSIVAGQYNYTITPAADATSVHIAHNLAYTYTMYWDSIVIYLA